MPGPFVVGGPIQAFVNGVKLISGIITFTNTGGANGMVTFDGEVFAPGVQTHRCSIKTPVFDASPMDVVKLAWEITATPGLLNIVDGVNGKTYNTNLYPNDDTTTWDPEKAAEQDWDVKCSKPIPA
jgi:hypothetical protein